LDTVATETLAFAAISLIVDIPHTPYQHIIPDKYITTSFNMQ